MTKAIRIHETGGPEALRWEDISLGDPGAGEIRVRHTAIGLNFIDTYHRSGLYPVPLPATLGMEGAGVVDAVGPDVTDIRVGDRVAYSQPMGSYAEARLMPAQWAVVLPDGIPERTAAAAMLKGLTVQYLIRQTYRVQSGQTVLFHAAAGGVGLIASQWLKALGVRVIGTASTAEKAELARAHGCAEVIVTGGRDTADIAREVRRLTDGAGVPVVYDGIGKDTFAASLDCLQPLGMMVSFGNASGAVPPFSIATLAQKGSLILTRPTLAAYASNRERLQGMARDLFEVIANGSVRIEINQTYPLAEAARAHRDLEARRTTGSSLLLP